MFVDWLCSAEEYSVRRSYESYLQARTAALNPLQPPQQDLLKSSQILHLAAYGQNITLRQKKTGFRNGQTEHEKQGNRSPKYGKQVKETNKLGPDSHQYNGGAGSTSPPFSVYICVRPIRLCNAVNENNPSVVIVQVALRKWVERMW
jgi:hypothetical protein